MCSNKLVKDRFVILLAAFFLFSSGCEEIIDVDVSEIKNQIVIDGTITNSFDQNSIKISLSESIFTETKTSTVSGARVILSDDKSNIETIKESKPGLYLPLSMQGIPGRTYTLKVEFSGKSYTAVSTMPQPMEFDSIEYYKSSDFLFYQFTPLYKIKVYLSNKLGVEEYCLIKLYAEGSNNKKEIALYSDKYSDGKQIILDNFSSLFSKNSVVHIELLSINKAAYDYFYVLNAQSGNDGIELPELFNMNSFNPRSNINNNALGFFSANTYRKYTITIR